MPKKKRSPFHFVEGKGWCYHTSVVLPTGDRIYVSGRWFSTKGEAEADFEQKKVNALEKETGAPSEFLFKDFLEDFENYRSLTVNSSTMNSIDKYKIPLYITPFFDGKRMREAFTLTSVRKWYMSIRNNQSMSHNLQAKVVGLFKAMLKFAYQNCYIDAVAYQQCDVACLPIKGAKDEAKEVVVWSRAECAQFLSAIPKGSEDEVIMSTFVDGALRISEFLALKVEDFDFEKTSISVNKQVRFEFGSWILDGKLKSGNSKRTVILSNQTALMLQDYIESMGLLEGDFLFSCQHGHKVPMSPHAFRVRWSKYISLSKVPYCNPHAIRHYKVSEAAKHIDSLEEAKIIADQMGHSVTVNFRSYLETRDKEFAKEVVEKIAKA